MLDLKESGEYLLHFFSGHCHNVPVAGKGVSAESGSNAFRGKV